MASVTLSQSREYRLEHDDQDWHGWQVHDTAGNLIGRVADFIIDTDESRAVSIVLDTGGEVPLADLLVEDGSLVVWGEDAVQRVAAPSLQSFEAGTLDVVERVEVAVFRKRPVVIEELVIDHEIVDRKARIQTTLRRRDVEVERFDQ